MVTQNKSLRWKSRSVDAKYFINCIAFFRQSSRKGKPGCGLQAARHIYNV